MSPRRGRRKTLTAPRLHLSHHGSRYNFNAQLHDVVPNVARSSRWHPNGTHMDHPRKHVVDEVEKAGSFVSTVTTARESEVNFIARST